MPCRPLLHAAVQLRGSVRQTFGVEFDAVKCEKALHIVMSIANDDALVLENGLIDLDVLPVIINRGIEQVGS